MTQYVDANAYLSIYLREQRGPAARVLLDEDPDWITGAHTEVEVRRGIARSCRGLRLREAQTAFAADWARTQVVDLDHGVCQRAALIAIATGIKTLDALHLAAAGPARPATRLVTYDRRLAETARTFGWDVAGAA